MRITDELNVTRRGNEFIIEYCGNTDTVSCGVNPILDEFYTMCRSREIEVRPTIFEEYSANNGDFLKLDVLTNNANGTTPTISKEEIVVRGVKKLMNFMTEFEFEPNFRFVNTLTCKVAEDKKEAKAYIVNYFSLMDNSYTNEVKEKVKSREFEQILDDLSACGKPSHIVNNRFKVYFGSAGTGKTTLAQTETNNRCAVCNASMLPSDLMEDFVFVNGQPSFKPSTVWECMENGLPIVLDEINLLPFDSLRFLQGILDGKSEFNYKGHTVHIKDGFQIIGTMNLTIGGMTYGLPEPLVDRASDMKKFTLTANQLAKSILE